MARVRTMENVYLEFVTADRAVIAVIATIDEDHRYIIDHRLQREPESLKFFNMTTCPPAHPSATGIGRVSGHVEGISV